MVAIFDSSLLVNLGRTLFLDSFARGRGIVAGNSDGLGNFGIRGRLLVGMILQVGEI